MPSTPLFPEIMNKTQPAAAYIGGKRKLAKQICRAIDRIDHRGYVEVFMGMGGVFFRRSRKAPVEIINDWSEDVSTFFRILQRHYVAFLDMLRFQISTRAGFDKLLRVDPSTQTDLERSARFLYLQRLSYGGKVAQRNFGVDPYSSSGFDLSKIAPLLEAIHERMTPVTIEKLTWSDCIERYDLATTLFYLDPPYYGCEGDYGADLFDRSQFAKMAQQLSTIEGKFLLSLNDRPEVRSLFSGFSMYEVSLIYSIGGGDKSVQASELIISNLAQSELDRVMAD